ncbi:MAG: FAD-dependent oxidoreductase [Chitinophagales bacterium]
MSKQIVIAGAGQAAIQAATTLRSEGFEGNILMIADELDLPYQKPPLSKGFLMDKLQERNLLFKTEKFFEEKNIQLVLGEKVIEIFPVNKAVKTNTSNAYNYDALIIATGTKNRILNIPGQQLKGIHYLRSLEDAKALKEKMATAKKLVVIGGGFIGLEIAAAANEKGLDVSVLEVQDRLMARVLPPVISDVFEAKHIAKGVNIQLQKSATAFIGEDDHVTGVEMDDGHVLAADLVVVGIGVVPNDEFAEAAGIKCSNGIEVDDYTRTNIDDIYAIGDVACHYNDFMQSHLRLESVQNAMDQGRIAALHILGKDEKYYLVPWFWTHQFELKLQMAGCNQGYDEYVTRGDVEEEKYSIFYLKDGKLIGVDSINRASDHMAARKLIQAGVTPTTEQIEDLEFKLKTLID